MQPTMRYSAYQVTATHTAKPKEEIVLLLYEGALRFIRFARTSLQQKNPATKGLYISKALAIIGELDCLLDHEIGGEIAGNLSSLYQYMSFRLTHANCKNDGAALDEVTTLLRELQQAFATAIEQQRSTVIAPAATSPSAKGLNIAV